MFSITHQWIFVHNEEKLWHLGSTPHKLAFEHLPTHTSTLQLPYEIVFLSRDHATIKSESKLDLKLVVPVQFLKFFFWTRNFELFTLRLRGATSTVSEGNVHYTKNWNFTSCAFSKFCQLSLMKAAQYRCKIFKISSTKAEENVPQCKTSKISSTEVERAMYPRPKFHFESASQSWGAYIT